MEPSESADAAAAATTDGPDDAMASVDASAGGWLRDEHVRFMQALETYGGERSGDAWHKIAAFVQTRSLDEVQLHGQQYLSHLVQLHQLQQQQQRQLRQPTPTPTPSYGSNQNDPNGPNYTNSKTIPGASASAVKASPSRLSAAAQSVANAMNAHILVRPSDAMPVAVGVRKPPTTTTNRPAKAKTWTFHEDKVLETALAAWQLGKPYSWPKIAASLPGKTAKDVRLRYEQLVDDIASITDTGTVPSSAPLAPISTPVMTASGTAAAAAGRPPTHSGLSRRIAPPPPIQVPPPSARGKGDSPGSAFPGSRTSARGRFALTPSFGVASGMLSPTFLDFLASEDRPPMPGGLSDLPSPLLPSPLGLDGHTPHSRRSLVTPRTATTPRIWHEFLADDFKFDPKAPSPSASAARPPTSTSKDEHRAATDTASDKSQRRPDE